MLEGFLTYSILPLLTDEGVWAAPNPAPLTEAEVFPVFEKIAKSDAYERQHLTQPTMDGRLVVLMNGLVHSEPAEGTPWEDAPEVFER